MLKLVGISGKICSGKTTVSNYLIDHYGYHRVSLAGPLKLIGKCVIKYYQEVEEFKHDPYKLSDVVEETLEQLDMLLEDVILSIPPYNELPVLLQSNLVYNAKIALLRDLWPQFRDADWSVEKNESIRHLYQFVGEILRQRIDDGIWVKYMLHDIELLRKQGIEYFVCDDLRQKSEYSLMKQFGFEVIRLDVSKDMQDKRVKELYGYIEPERHQHISEVDLDDVTDFDSIVNADKSLDQVLKEVISYVGGQS